LAYFLCVADTYVSRCLRPKRTPILLLAGVRRRTTISPELAVTAESHGLPRLAGFTAAVNQDRLFREETIYLVKLPANSGVKIAFCERQRDLRPFERCQVNRRGQHSAVLTELHW
jgi:hypothetical protein